MRNIKTVHFFNATTSKTALTRYDLCIIIILYIYTINCTYYSALDCIICITSILLLYDDDKYYKMCNIYYYQNRFGIMYKFMGGPRVPIIIIIIIIIVMNTEKAKGKRTRLGLRYLFHF